MKTENKHSKIEELKAKAAKTESTAKRRELIAAFYEFIRNGAPVKVFNSSLKKDIHITSKSERETIAHAGKSQTSTIAVFDLLNILGRAKKVSESPIKPNSKKQQDFQKIITLSDDVEGVGEVKLTVGVYKGTGKHIQYCLTAVK